MAADSEKMEELLQKTQSAIRMDLTAVLREFETRFEIRVGTMVENKIKEILPAVIQQINASMEAPLTPHSEDADSETAEKMQRVIETLGSAETTWATVVAGSESGSECSMPSTTAHMTENTRPASVSSRSRGPASISSRCSRDDDRKRNVVVYGFKESGKNDLENFKSLCLTEFDFSVEISTCNRLGQTTAGKVRPLLVKFMNESDTEKVLSVARDLRLSTDEYTNKNVFIVADLPKQELNALKKNREEKQRAYLKSTNTKTK